MLPLLAGSRTAVRAPLGGGPVEEVPLDGGWKAELPDGGQPPLAHGPPDAEPTQVGEGGRSCRPRGGGWGGVVRETCLRLLARGLRRTVELCKNPNVAIKTNQEMETARPGRKNNLSNVAETFQRSNSDSPSVSVLGNMTEVSWKEYFFSPLTRQGTQRAGSRDQFTDQ